MLILLACFVYMFSVTYSNICSDEPSKDLKQIYVIMRHGARNPIGFFPTDPNKDYDFLGGVGQLTNLGKLQAYSMGQFLRNRYCNFLTSNPKEVYARSSAEDRTIETAMAALAGLYPPEDKWIWNKELKWQPIPVYTIPPKDDYLLHVLPSCPAAFEEITRFSKSKEWERYFKEIEEFRKYLSDKTGWSLNGIYEVLITYSTLDIEWKNNLTMPSWVTEDLLQKLEKYATSTFQFFFGTKLLQRLKGGPLIGDIINKIQSRLNGESGRKIFFYSTHDVVVATVMSALNVYNNKLPPFCATIIVELHSSGNNSFLRFFYSNSTTPESGDQKLHVLRLPFCETDCPLETFIQLTKDIIPIEVKKECFQE